MDPSGCTTMVTSSTSGATAASPCRRFIVAAVAVALTFLAVACGGGEGNSVDDGASPALKRGLAREPATSSLSAMPIAIS